MSRSSSSPPRRKDLPTNRCSTSRKTTPQRLSTGTVRRHRRSSSSSKSIFSKNRNSPRASRAPPRKPKPPQRRKSPDRKRSPGRRRRSLSTEKGKRTSSPVGRKNTKNRRLSASPFRLRRAGKPGDKRTTRQGMHPGHLSSSGSRSSESYH